MILLGGISTRSLSLLSNHLLGRNTHEEIILANIELRQSVKRRGQRDLSWAGVKYLFVQEVHFAAWTDSREGNLPVLVAVGVTETGACLVLGLRMGDKESPAGWGELFEDLKR